MYIKVLELIYLVNNKLIKIIDKRSINQSIKVKRLILRQSYTTSIKIKQHN